jgi:glycosyltransferase involved in cell wall biosynthesis
MISVADAMTDLMVEAKVAPREKFTTIYSGMEVEPFLAAEQLRAETRATYGFSDGDVVIGKIARLFHLKGHDDLITAASCVVRRVPNVRFLLVGDGILRDELQKRVADMSLEKHFVFAGLVPPTQVPAMIGAMDVLIHTSYREGLARALPQALIAGRPVISYDVDGAREVVVTGETGVLVPPQNTDALAEAMIQLAVDGRLRQQYGRCGQERFTDQFRHQTMTRRIRQLYQDVLDQEGEGP